MLTLNVGGMEPHTNLMYNFAINVPKKGPKMMRGYTDDWYKTD